MKHRSFLLVILAIFVIFSASFAFASQEESKKKVGDWWNVAKIVIAGEKFEPTLDTYSVLGEGENFKVYKDTEPAQNLSSYFERMYTLQKEKGFRAVLPAIKIKAPSVKLESMEAVPARYVINVKESDESHKLFTNKIVVRFREDSVAEKDAKNYLREFYFTTGYSLLFKIDKRPGGNFLLALPLTHSSSTRIVIWCLILQDNPNIESANPFFVYSNRLYR